MGPVPAEIARTDASSIAMDGVTEWPDQRYGWFVVGVLTLAYTCSFIDRQILNILQEPIKHELHLSDTELGLLTGFSFTLVYITVGIAVGRLADATSRKTVVGASLAIWSGFTALSGLATSYWTLLAARLRSSRWSRRSSRRR